MALVGRNPTIVKCCHQQRKPASQVWAGNLSQHRRSDGLMALVGKQFWLNELKELAAQLSFCNFLLFVATPFPLVVCIAVISSSPCQEPHHSQKYNQVIGNRLHLIIRLDVCRNDHSLRSPALLICFYWNVNQHWHCTSAIAHLDKQN